MFISKGASFLVVKTDLFDFETNIFVFKNHTLTASVNIGAFNKGSTTISTSSNTVYIFLKPFFMDLTLVYTYVLALYTVE